jgi:tetratricopeptide (TPR) repeat protein
MRQLNVKLVLGLLGGTMVLALGLFGIHALQAGRIAQALLWQAHHARDEGQTDKAVTYWQRYLEFAPNDVEERANLGAALASDHYAGLPRAREQALFNLDQVLRKQPGRDDVRKLLARVTMELKRYEVARGHLDELLRTSPGDAEVERLFALWHDSQHKYQEAASWYRKAIEHNPAEVDNYRRLSEILRKHPDLAKQSQPLGDPAKVMDELVAKNPDSCQAHLTRFHYWSDGDKGELPQCAKEDVQRALALAPEEADVLLAAAQLERKSGNSAGASAFIQRGFELHPDDARLYQAKAELELQAGHFRQAGATLESGVAVVKPEDRIALLWQLANLVIDDKDYAEAANVLSKLRQANLEGGRLDFLTGRIMVGRKEWTEAARTLERARPLVEGDPRLLRQIDGYLAECFGELDEPARQMAAFERIIAENPGASTAYLGLATALGRAGKIDEAIDVYQRLLRLPGAPADGWVELARLLVIRNQREQRPDWTEVEEALRRAEAANPGSVDVTLLRADLLLAKGERIQAEGLLRDSRERQPGQIKLWTASALAADQAGKSALAGQLLDEGERRAGDSVELRMARARHLAMRGGPDAVTGLRRQASSLERFSTAGAARILQSVVAAFLQMGNFVEAAHYCGLLAKQPAFERNLGIQRTFFELALECGDPTAMNEALARIALVEGSGGPLGSYGKAMQLIWQGKKEGKPELLEEARRQLEAVALQRPNWPAVLVAKGNIEDVNGNVDKAITQYRSALALGERNPLISRRLIQLLSSLARYDEAEEELRKLEAQSGLDLQMRRLQAEAALHTRKLDRAIALARQAVPANSTDYRDYLWLGQLLSADKARESEAEQALRKAVDLSPRTPDAWLALCRHLVTHGKAAEAETVIAQARQKLDPQSLPLTMGQAYETLGQYNEAAQQYESALARQPTDAAVRKQVIGFCLRTGRHHRAEELLASMMDGKIKTTTSDQNWARRNSAILLASGDYHLFQKALSLVGLQLGESGVEETQNAAIATSQDEDRARIRVLTMHSARPFRGKAISLMERLRTEVALGEEEQVVLAMLYDADGAWSRARSLWRSLITSQPQAAETLSRAAQSCLRHGEVELGQQAVERLEQMESARGLPPGALGSLGLRSALREARGDVEGALGLLRSQASRKGARPEEVLTAAALLGRHKRGPEALEICSQAWKTCPPETVGATCLAVLGAGLVNPGHAAQVERQLRAALERKPESTILLIQLANLKQIQEQYAEAEHLYRQVLEKDSNNLVALNNLAWLLGRSPSRAAEALALVNRALDRYGPRADLLDTRGVIYLSLGEVGPAQADISAAVADTPSATRLLQLARAQNAGGNRSEAQKTLASAKAAGLLAGHLNTQDQEDYRRLTADLEAK